MVAVVPVAVLVVERDYHTQRGVVHQVLLHLVGVPMEWCWTFVVVLVVELI